MIIIHVSFRVFEPWNIFAIVAPVFNPIARVDKEEIGLDTLSVILPASSKILFAFSIVILKAFKIKKPESLKPQEEL